MKAASSRQETTAARKEQIVRATIALLAERGYHATTFDAICQSAGLSSKRLITYHFSSKDELCLAAADLVVVEAEAFMRPALDSASGIGDLLATIIRSNVAFIAGHLGQARALQQIILNIPQIWQRHHENSIDRLAALLTEGQRTGQLQITDPRVTAAALRASIDSMYPLLVAGADPTTCANQLIELFDRGIRPR